ncbi:transposase [Streptomyces spiralis]|uniref:transposase n=1 Tax=Streptomyces spiralis TaxID=66376 RepID=UPI0036A6018A
MFVGSAQSHGDRPNPAWDGCERHGELAGPRRADDRTAHHTSHLAKFHAPEIVLSPGPLAELGHCALRVGGRRPFLVTDPGLMEAGWVDEAVGHLRLAGLRPWSGTRSWHQDIAWQLLPVELGFGSGQTCWRRLDRWQRAGVFDQLHHVLLAELNAAGELDWSRAYVDGSHVRAKKGVPRPVRRRSTGGSRAANTI